MKKSFFGVFVFTVLCTHAQPNYVSPSNLKAYWPFNTVNLANDVVASFVSTLNPLQSPPFLTSNRFGTTGEAFNFSGANWISTSYKGVLGDSARTVSFWAKTPGTNGVGMYPVGWGEQTAGNRFGCSLDYPANQVAVGGAFCSQVYNTPTPTSDNKWHHYTFEFGPTIGPSLADVKAWQDAIQLFTVSANAYNPNQPLFTINGFNVTFGQILYPGQPSFYMGDLDEIGIWKRLLSQCEISDLYYSDLSVGNMAFNSAGYTGAVNNLAQYTKTVTGNSTFQTPVTGSTFSGIGVSSAANIYNFNSPPTLPPGSYTITHTYTLQGGCVRTNTQVIVVRSNVGIQAQNETLNELKIYPNPAGDFFNLSGTNHDTTYNIEISDITGKPVLKTEDSDGTINTSALSNGLYFVSITDPQNNFAFRKLVIARHR